MRAGKVKRKVSTSSNISARYSKLLGIGKPSNIPTASPFYSLDSIIAASRHCRPHYFDCKSLSIASSPQTLDHDNGRAAGLSSFNLPRSLSPSSYYPRHTFSTMLHGHRRATSRSGTQQHHRRHTSGDLSLQECGRPTTEKAAYVELYWVCRRNPK